MKKTLLIITGIALTLAAAFLVRDIQKTYFATTPTVTSQLQGLPLDNPRGVLGANARPASITQTVTIPVTASTTVLSAMQAYASQSQFTFTGEEYPSLGYFVDSINGKRSGDGHYWILYINWKSADLGASNATIHAGDTVEWRYEKSY